MIGKYTVRDEDVVAYNFRTGTKYAWVRECEPGVPYIYTSTNPVGDSRRNITLKDSIKIVKPEKVFPWNGNKLTENFLSKRWVARQLDIEPIEKETPFVSQEKVEVLPEIITPVKINRTEKILKLDMLLKSHFGVGKIENYPALIDKVLEICQ